MDGYSHRPRGVSFPDRWRVRPVLEPLEARDLLHVASLVARAGLAAQALAGRNVVRAHLPPRIIEFIGVEEGPNVWTFQGQVVGDNAAGLVVQFGGIPSLEGQTATTDANGFFQLTVRLNPGEDGTATAQTTDRWGQSSNVARTLVDPGPYVSNHRHQSH